MFEAIIQRVTTVDTKGGGYAIVLSTVSVGDQQLLELMHGRGKQYRFTLEAMQQALDLGDNPNEGIPAGVERAWQTAGGDVVTAHAYQTPKSGTDCSHCGFGPNHDVHNETARKLLEQLDTDEAQP